MACDAVDVEFDDSDFWDEPAYVTCEELKPDGVAEIIYSAEANEC
jgi:hypothetical protein